MGGKHKQAQRIKNNARPSSSGRSAELLASSSQIPQSMREIRFVPPTLSLLKTEEFDNSVSPDFQIVFKKMNKKDSTTKIKALQEFGDLIQTSEIEAVKPIVAFWATLYNILATDTDHKVREAVHNAHYQIVLKDKKIIAPFLKQLIGPWFTSQYDNYPPAASSAVKSFTTAFPQNKIQDCVVFCQKEILGYIFENLTSKVETGLKGNTEEIEAKFERIVISSLQGYCLYLETVTVEHIEKCVDLNKQIITNSKFLKLATHKLPIIRAAWFKVLATLYHKAPFLLQDDQSHLVAIIFNNLDESEPAVVGYVWDAALLIMDLGQDWWKHINVEKNYVSKLKKVLRDGGQGNASAIYPNLLSFLHKLPQTLRVDQFYDSFFECLRFGLKKKSVLSSKSESTAIVTALTECLQYVILLNHDNADLCQKLIKTHLIALIDWSFKAEQVCYRTLFHRIAVLIQYWNRNKTINNYSNFLNLFWENLKILLVSPSLFDEENDNLTDRQIVLFQTLKHVAKPKEQMTVKFSQESEVSNDSKLSTNDIDSVYTANLIEVAYTLINSYVQQIELKKSNVLLRNLFSVVQLFESRDFLVGLAANLKNQTLLGIFNLLSEWLKSSDLECEVVVDLVFIIFRYVTDEEKKIILSSFLEFCENDCFVYCMKNALSHPFNDDKIIQNWLQSPQIGEFLVGITDKNLTLECSSELKNVFKLAFTEFNGELLIDKEVIAQIINKLKIPLSEPQNFDSIDSCAHLASYVTDRIYTETTLLKYGDDLLLALFEFSCQDHSDLEFLVEDTQFEINSSWQDVITLLSKNLQKEDFFALVGKCVQLVELNFFKFDSYEKLIEVIVDFIKAVFNGQPLMVSEVFDLFFNRDFVLIWKNEIEVRCLLAEYLSGDCANPIGPYNQNGDFSEDDIFKYFLWSLIKVSVLISPLETIENDDEDEEENLPEIKEIFLAFDHSTLLIIQLLYDISMCQSYLDNYKMSKNYAKILQHYDAIKEKTKIAIEKMQIQGDVEKWLTSNVTSFLSCKAIYLFHDLLSNATKDSFKKYQFEGLSMLHLCQNFGHILDFDSVEMTSSLYDNIVILQNLAHCDDIEVQIAEVFEKVKKLRSQDVSRFLFDSKSSNWAETETVIEIIRLFSKLVSKKFDSLTRQHWDFGVICLSSWAANCNKLRNNYENPQIQAFMIAVSQFYVSLSIKIGELKQDKTKSSFVEEWEDLFLPNIHSDLFQLWLFLSDQFNNKESLTIIYHPFLREFGKICQHFHHKFIFNKENNLPSWGKILKRCTKLLVNSTVLLQIWGYKMLLVLLPGLVEIDLQADSSSTPNIKGFTIEQFREILLQTDNIVDGVLASFRLGEDSCQVTTFTDSYTYVFAYLLLWNVLLNLCEKSPPELRYQYADWFRNDDYFKSLLNNLFKLLPSEVLHYSEGKAKAFTKLFLNEPKLALTEACTSEQIEHFSCWICYQSLSQMPALVRTWWSETETKISQIVERVTTFYISPQLCNQELSDVGSREIKFKNMTIKIIPSVREVIAIYTVDEAQMELVITLPQNYPLGGPDVRCGRQLGGPLHKQWLMQLKKYLLHQNGRIWDGLSLWNSSLDKKFDGVEECYICFAVLHPGTYQLPKLTCQTCKKKFHSPCLYKWFSTSNKSSCPICRNLF